MAVLHSDSSCKSFNPDAAARTVPSSWNKKQAVALQTSFYATLPQLDRIPKEQADIAHVRDRITFVHGDGLAVMRAPTFRGGPTSSIRLTRRGSVGKRLYIHNQLDHEERFRIAAVCGGPVLMTYDDDAEVRDLARRHGFDTHLVPMKSTHHPDSGGPSRAAQVS